MPTRYLGSPQEVRALDTYIKLMRATDSLNARLQKPLDRAGLTLGQLGVLELLLHVGPMNQKQIGGKILRSHANVSTLIDNLERNGLVTRTRDAQDRRAVMVALTDAGRQRISAYFPEHARAVAELMAALSPEQQEQLGALCKTLGLACRGGGTDEPR